MFMMTFILLALFHVSLFKMFVSDILFDNLFRLSHKNRNFTRVRVRVTVTVSIVINTSPGL